MNREAGVRLVRVLLAFALVLGVAGLPAAAEFTKHSSIDAEKLYVRNLVGEIRVEGHGGSSFEIEVEVRGSDASPGLIDVVTNEGSRNELIVVFPVEESRRYVYPEMGNSNTHIDDDGNRGWLARLFGALGGGITVSGRGRGLEVWADVTVRVPRGKTIEIDHGVGKILAGEVEGDLVLAVKSGRVSVAAVTGSVDVDTGSGRVSIEDVHGNIRADTGSGRVTVNRSEGDNVDVDTGSGSVALDSIETRTLRVDTGSGGVKARSVGADGAEIDTGSGSVVLELVRMGNDHFEIDTGSGSIDLLLPRDASADVSADTGSGGIRIDLEGDYTVRQEDRDEAEVRVGGGAARVVLDTGSGSISITQER